MVGNIGFTTTNGHNLTIALDPDNIPYVVYGYYSGSYKVEVMKFNGSAWEMVGDSAFPEPSSEADLDFSAEGIPYLAYTDANNGYREAVQRYVNGSWERVGVLGTAAGAAYGINLEFDSNDIPYIAYRDQGNGTKATVKKFNNDAWELVGIDGFTSGSTVYTTMAISSEDIPYVIYKDYDNNGKLSVQRFSNNTWEIVGDAGFSASSLEWPSIKVSNDGTVYCVYYSNMDKIFAKKFSDNSLPVFTSDEEVSITENETSVIDINAMDNDGDMEGNGLSYTFSSKNNEGVDNDLFQLEPITGELSFQETPNFEVPLDEDMDQIYDVQVAVTDSKGGVATQRILVNISNINELVLDISTTAAACYDGNSGMATITVDQGNKGYLFELSQNEINIGESITTQDPSYTFDALVAGHYSVLVTDNEGDTVSQSFTIDQPEVLQVNANNTLESYEGANDGSVELTISGGTAPYVYIWSNGETSRTVTGLGNGPYSVTVKDANDCSIDLSVTVGLNVPPKILSSASIAMDENTVEVTDISVSDTEGDLELQGIVYSLTTNDNGGEDNSLFSLNTDLGIIQFATAPDFENPIDADEDNTYHLQITAEDSYGATSLQNITVIILDLQDDVDDYDKDGISDELDADDDNDGVTDTEDVFPLDASEDTDTDSDGIGNNADEDDDKDGVTDTEDAFSLDALEDTDTDGDGIGNNADEDDDNDGVTDTEDALPLNASEDTDVDGDGIGNNADEDDDNDGVPDTEDTFPLDGSEDTDADGDGIGNNADTDDDNDGILDFQDAFPTESTPLVIPAEAFTPNGDGVNDFWIVPGIDNYPNNTVRVYNRSGNAVFEAGNYKNNWAGGYNNNNGKLPAGSYFYVIELGNGQQPVQGWIFINY
jgi:gliding motility-associated-like protein